MTILLFGVSNVGKTTIGKILADKLGFAFYDLDEEVKKCYSITLEEFVKIGTIEERDKKRGRIIRSLVEEKTDKVIAITPMSYRVHFEEVLKNDRVVAIELRDTAENIFERLVFSDENDCIYKDDDYKNAHMEYYLRDIREDIDWYGEVYSIIRNRYDIDNESPETAADSLIKRFGLLDMKHTSGG